MSDRICYRKRCGHPESDHTYEDGKGPVACGRSGCHSGRAISLCPKFIPKGGTAAPGTIPAAKDRRDI